MKISLIVLGGLVASFLLRHRSAALRHWVLAAAIACAAAVPLVEAIVPAWRLPIAAPAAFEPYVDDAQQAAATTPTDGRGVAPRNVSRRPSPVSGWRVRLRSRRNTPVDMDCRYGCQLINPRCRHSSDEMARCAGEACDARTVERPRWRDLAGIRPSTQRRIARKRSSVAAGHVGLQAARRSSCPRLPAAWSDERTRVVLTHELAHIRRGDWVVQIARRFAARGVLVQPAAVDRLQEDSVSRANMRAMTKS